MKIRNGQTMILFFILCFPRDEASYGRECSIRKINIVIPNI